MIDSEYSQIRPLGYLCDTWINLPQESNSCYHGNHKPARAIVLAVETPSYKSRPVAAGDEQGKSGRLGNGSRFREFRKTVLQTIHPLLGAIQ